MKRCTLAGVLIAVGLLTPAHASAAAGVSTAVDDATLFRVFLKDGTTLVSYGEFARVEDRGVAFSQSGHEPGLQHAQLLPDRIARGIEALDLVGRTDAGSRLAPARGLGRRLPREGPADRNAGRNTQAAEHARH